MGRRLKRMLAKDAVLSAATVFVALQFFCSTAAIAQGHAVIPSTGVMVIYLPPKKLFLPKQHAAIEKTYKKQIAQLKTKAAIWSAFHTLADNTYWIDRAAIGQHAKDGSMELSQLHEFSIDPSVDVVIMVLPAVMLTKDMKGLMLAVKILSTRNTPSGPIGYKSRDITETVSLERAGAPLTSSQLASVGVDDSTAAAQARAAIWFAHDANRVRTAMLLDLTEVIQQLKPFLESFQ